MEAVVVADVAVVLLVGFVLTRALKPLRQPPVVAEIFAGIALGPSVLGLLPGDLPQRLFPDDARPMLSAIAQVGLLLFMFLAGWEMNLGLLRGRSRSVGSAAGLSLVVPFLFGVGAAFLLHDGYAGDGVGAGAFALYLGTAFAITAFPVLARVIRDGRLAETRVGTTAMACAAVGDVLAWSVLVLVVAVVESAGAGQFALVVLLTLGYVLAMLLVVRPLLRVAISRATRRGHNGSVVTLIVSGVFLSAYDTSWIGVHAIFGAFAFGLITPRNGVGAGLHDHLGAPLARVAALLLPVFFIVTGLSVDVTALGWPEVLALALILTTAVAGKLAGAIPPARLSGMSWREATAFGVLMNTRGLTEIVILDIGRHLGIINDTLFSMMVVMAVVTTAMAGPLLQVIGIVRPDPAVPEARRVEPGPGPGPGAGVGVAVAQAGAPRDGPTARRPRRWSGRRRPR
ncbi:cation:proton antiporter domain-containing protein [Streptomyces sp. 4N509B]|uniref:cation:proton antiporter domain-containing protein n=1 Tax=Streptomyces sp. 4N509B TaxID=3457413 RepID=UPI003FCFFB4D